MPRGTRAQDWGTRSIKLLAMEVGHEVQVEDRCRGLSHCGASCCCDNVWDQLLSYDGIGKSSKRNLKDSFHGS